MFYRRSGFTPRYEYSSRHKAAPTPNQESCRPAPLDDFGCLRCRQGRLPRLFSPTRPTMNSKLRSRHHRHHRFYRVAFFHRGDPDPLAPFRLLVSRARGWNRSKTLAVSAFAGTGPCGADQSQKLGLVIAWFGFKLDESAGRLFPLIAGGVLVAIGVFYLWRQWSGRGVLHHHPSGGHHQASEECGHKHDHSHFEDELKDSHLVSKKAGDWAAISGLFMMLTLSPCEGFLPIYLSGVQFGWRGFFCPQPHSGGRDFCRHARVHLVDARGSRESPRAEIRALRSRHAGRDVLSARHSVDRARDSGPGLISAAFLLSRT